MVVRQLNGLFPPRRGKSNIQDIRYKKMRDKILDLFLIIFGVVLTPWAIMKWSEIGFRLEPKFYAGNRDGSFFLVATMLGVAMISYGLFNILVLRRKKNNESSKNPSIDLLE